AASDPLKQPFFGDLHVHTRYSLDASTQGTRTTPEQAYRFARGERLELQPWTANGWAQRSLQLSEPLDFAMVSDHAELIGDVLICNQPGMEGFDSWQCKLYRNWPRAAYYLFNFMATIQQTHLGMCGENGEICREAAITPWREMQQAAEKFYDRSADCSFTTFIGYEWTAMNSDVGGNLHRNVVFANDRVPRLPASFIETPGASLLWASLDEECVNAGTGCDALVIPHNSNLSAGKMFSRELDAGGAMDAAYATSRERYERVVEMIQHKGASECFYQQGVTEDELCAFELLPKDNIAGLDNPPTPDTGFVRKALNDGMQLEQALGVNPYKFGFIGSTDTHLGAPGATEEDRFLGHGGAGVPARDEIPPGLPDKLTYNPGGLAVVWAEHNTREALFDGMQRRETYATSGSRIVTRFFGGWKLAPGLCDAPDRVAIAYEQGVPMGSDLPAQPPTAGAPSFLVAARQDSVGLGGGGTPLQRIQVVKSWLDEGARRETVYDVAGDPDNGATVDTRTCATSGPGFAELCTVWTDPDFNASQRALYYTRVIENPTCRWSQRMCAAAQVDCAVPSTIGYGFEGCCDEQHRPVIQERAWTSPIWYTPE
ncbi:MAG: DUF3604 domain-containing protein, partial [Halioglobus sp.]